MSRKMGFWSVFALVMGSQVGSGVFMLPANLAPYGIFSLGGWIISGLGAVALALVFAKLCSWFPQTGGPHVYVKEAFGLSAAFFTGWTYWVVSWVSTTVLIIASIGYLTPLIGCNTPTVNIFLEIGLLLAITALNFRGVTTAGRAEFLLTMLKLIPLFIVPILALYYFNSAHFSLDSTVAHLTTQQILGRVTLLTMWGFVGLETATTSAGSVDNPSKTIPRAVIVGTICVALLYLISSLGIMGAIPGKELAHSNAPYADVVQFIFGGNWHLVISVLASIACIGSLNAWTMTSGQTVLGLAQDGLMPAFFGRKNKYDAPYLGILTSSIGIIAFLIMTANKSLVTQILMIIDFSVTAFLFVYTLCCLAFLRLLLQKKANIWRMLPQLIYGSLALIFCGWVIYETQVYVILIASLFTLIGLPFYLLFLSKQIAKKRV
ncbi:MAG: amino acid permease [bacterium]|nr:amino acid permease [bacterium]